MSPVCPREELRLQGHPGNQARAVNPCHLPLQIVAFGGKLCTDTALSPFSHRRPFSDVSCKGGQEADF